MADLFEHAKSIDETSEQLVEVPVAAASIKPAHIVPIQKATKSSDADITSMSTTAPKASKAGSYSAKDIEVLEGLEPVRRRPGMYIGGTDERAFHHLAAEILDNSMDEAVAGHASHITIELCQDQTVIVSDNGRGIPTDPHPKFKNKSALEVILTTLHSGGKFSGDSYETSGGLNGVGMSVVNALSDVLRVEIARDRKVWEQSYARGVPLGPLKEMGSTQNRRGTTVHFHPDPLIFGTKAQFRPQLLYKMARSKAYLFRGVEIRWKCDPRLLKIGDDTPDSTVLHFPGGLSDYLISALGGRKTVTTLPFAGVAKFTGGVGKAEWAIHWPFDEDPFFNSYCNTVPTPLGGTHEQGLRSALAKGVRVYGELIGNKQAVKVTGDDVVFGASIMLSVFISEPQFQGQTKDKLSTLEAHRLVENSVRDHFDHWLSGAPDAAKELLEHCIRRAEIRMKRRDEKQMKRQSATKRLRLPGKLSDCSSSNSVGTEIYLVEGDSAGGSAKQARNRKTQAVLPLRGKILNVASATKEKMRANQEISDLHEALGCGSGDTFIEDDLRYEKVIIMTDADVDGAHIAALLMTFFYKEMPELVNTGHLYLALPPLYRISQGGKTLYARDELHKDELMGKEFTGRGKIDISRFKGLGEMPPRQLKETTMAPENRTLLRVTVPAGQTDDEIVESRETEKLVDALMGKKPELRFQFIQENAQFISELDV
jgi:topoisomerase-4 subunit B